MNMRFRNHAVFPHFLFNLAIFINSKTGVSRLTRFGETLTYSAIRQVREETGLQIRITGLIGTYTDPHILIAYSDGEVRQEFTFVYAAEIESGHLKIEDESKEAAWVPLS